MYYYDPNLQLVLIVVTAHKGFQMPSTTRANYMGGLWVIQSKNILFMSLSYDLVKLEWKDIGNVA